NAAERASALHPCDPARAVVGAARLVLLRPAAELGPHEGEHSVRQAARLEVRLERSERAAQARQPVAEVAGLVVVGVEVALRLHRDRADAEWEREETRERL